MRDMSSRISLISVISATSDSDDVSESDESGKPIPLSCSVTSGCTMTLTSPLAAANAQNCAVQPCRTLKPKTEPALKAMLGSHAGQHGLTDRAPVDS